MLENFIKPESVIVDLESTDKEEVFEELNEVLISLCPSLDRSGVLKALLEREQKMTTGIIPGIAIPHAISDKIKEPVFAIGKSKKGIDFDSLDKKPVHIIFMILFPADDASLHLNIMQRLAMLFNKSEFYNSVMEKLTGEQIVNTILAIEESL